MKFGNEIEKISFDWRTKKKLPFLFYIDRLIHSLVVSLSIKPKIIDSMDQINENQKVNVGMRTAKCQGRIERYHQELTKYPLGKKIWFCFERNKKIYKDLLSKNDNLIFQILVYFVCF